MVQLSKNAHIDRPTFPIYPHFYPNAEIIQKKSTAQHIQFLQWIPIILFIRIIQKYLTPFIHLLSILHKWMVRIIWIIHFIQNIDDPLYFYCPLSFSITAPCLTISPSHPNIYVCVLSTSQPTRQQSRGSICPPPYVNVCIVRISFYLCVCPYQKCFWTETKPCKYVSVFTILRLLYIKKNYRTTNYILIHNIFLI